MKRIVTIQDISCIGKCSLTVALPIISAMGVETAVIPTAVLSTHTSFQNFTFKDLTEEILKIANHWENEKMNFDAIYTGYLGSIKQIDIIKTFIKKFKTPDNIVFIDPVMADNGKLYAGFTKEFVEEMRTLCAKADIIVPNITEASMLCHKEYQEVYDKTYILDLLDSLLLTGCQMAVITGVRLHDNKIGVIAKKANSEEIIYYENDLVNCMYHGTGDIFSSTFIGALTLRYPIEKAIAIAADYTRQTILLTNTDPDKRWYGVNFELAIPFLLKELNDKKPSIQ